MKQLEVMLIVARKQSYLAPIVKRCSVILGSKGCMEHFGRVRPRCTLYCGTQAWLVLLNLVDYKLTPRKRKVLSTFVWSARR